MYTFLVGQLFNDSSYNLLAKPSFFSSQFNRKINEKLTQFFSN